MFTLNCNGRLLVIERPIIMGIINATPDSFYEGSRKPGIDAILAIAEKMLKEGAAILDIGGQSTRPGSERLTADAELARVIGGIEAIHQQFPDAIISIDTYHSIVARRATEAGASIINDISAGTIDEAMIPTVAELGLPYVVMHMKGMLENMQQSAHYENVTAEVLDFLVQKTEMLRSHGIHDVIVDPGFGFAKNSAHNFELLKNLSVFKILDRPLMLGISRKSSIYKTLGVSPAEALNGTTVLNTIGLLQGASILRVHDVKEAREAIELVAACT